jgi:hypothetical protein
VLLAVVLISLCVGRQTIPLKLKSALKNGLYSQRSIQATEDESRYCKRNDGNGSTCNVTRSGHSEGQLVLDHPPTVLLTSSTDVIPHAFMECVFYLFVHPARYWRLKDTSRRAYASGRTIVLAYYHVWNDPIRMLSRSAMGVDGNRLSAAGGGVGCGKMIYG